MNKLLKITADTIKNDVAYESGQIAACQLIVDVYNKRAKKWPIRAFVKACGRTLHKSATNGQNFVA
jgi:hypothetical protein